MNWASPMRTIVPIGPRGALIVRFKTGNINTPNNDLSKVVAAEFGSPPSGRIAALSDQPCQFTQGVDGKPGAAGAGNAVMLLFGIGVDSASYPGYYPVLKQNTTYYVNIKNDTRSSSCVANQDCQMYVDLNKSPGT